eukprot:TRINITY_DN10167_c0_g1_i10.p2 TRINITY_DN10167_c0_g1~~TRINITY_DN10167_c0_g1_i10.p2  ORF type:complete len:201 (-),score=47.54 TRINITY_DN10167_c0_g1_i10:84-686(-)
MRDRITQKILNSVEMHSTEVALSIYKTRKRKPSSNITLCDFSSLLKEKECFSLFVEYLEEENPEYLLDIHFYKDVTKLKLFDTQEDVRKWGYSILVNYLGFGKNGTLTRIYGKQKAINEVFQMVYETEEVTTTTFDELLSLVSNDLERLYTGLPLWCSGVRQPNDEKRGTRGKLTKQARSMIDSIPTKRGKARTVFGDEG